MLDRAAKMDRKPEWDVFLEQIHALFDLNQEKIRLLNFLAVQYLMTARIAYQKPT